MWNGDEKNLQFQTDLQELHYALELIPYLHAKTASCSSLYSTDVFFNNPNPIYLPTEPHQILPTRSVQRTIERFHMTSRGHIGVPKQLNGGHVSVPNQSCESWTLFLCKHFLLFPLICIDAVHVSENALLVKWADMQMLCSCWHTFALGQ